MWYYYLIFVRERKHNEQLQLSEIITRSDAFIRATSNLTGYLDFLEPVPKKGRVFCFTNIAQMEEHVSEEHRVIGSIPIVGAKGM